MAREVSLSEGDDRELAVTMDAGDAPAPAGTLSPGVLFAGRYVIEALLGRGAMGEVHRALDQRVGDRVALKVLLPQGGMSAAEVERFRRELRLTRRITHRNVVRTYDLGEADGRPFITMEVIAGESLEQRLQRRAPFEPPEVTSIGAQLADGLAAAHEVGVVHRDLKPGNILIDDRGRVVTTDFGIARALDHERVDLARTAGVVGTPLYMSPEQLRGGSVGPASDLYSLGLVLYEMLVGEPAFAGETIPAIAVARYEGDGADPRSGRAVPDELAELVVRLTRRDPADRPGSAAEVAALLAGSSSSRPAPVARSTGKAAERSSVSSSGSHPEWQQSIAVLPFRQRGAPDAVAEGLAEELVDALSQVRSFRVLAMGATERFRESRDPRTVGSALDVGALVDGSVDRIGERVRINVRLIDAASGAQLWREKLDSPIEDLLEVQESICRRIAEALRVEMTANSRAATSSPEVMALYLGARRGLNVHAVADAPDALGAFERCLELDPTFSPAMAGHAIAWMRSGWLGGNDDWLVTAQDSVARALSHAAHLPETHLAAAMLSIIDGAFRDAVQSLHQALELAPTYAAAHQYLGDLQIEAGQVASGLRRAKLALELDPRQLSGLWAIARAAALKGDLDEYRATLARVPDDGADWALPALTLEVRVAGWQRDLSSLDQLARRLERMGTTARVVARTARYLCGEEEAAGIDDVIRRVRAGLRHPRMHAFLCQVMAEAHCLRGHPDLALEELENAAQSHLIDVLWIERCPALAPLRDDAAFSRLARAVHNRAAAMWTRR